MPVTIRDVAAASGVAIGTVSRALNGYPDVSDATRERIKQVASELGYAPNQTAQALSSKRVRNIGLFISGFLSEEVFNDFDLMLLRGAYRCALDRDVNVSLHLINSRIQEQKSFDQLCYENDVAGAVLFGLKTTDRYCTSLTETERPVVAIDIPIEGRRAGCVLLDDRRAEEQAARYLIACGHRSFAVVAGGDDAVVTHERLKGIRDACDAAGVDFGALPVLTTDFTHDAAAAQVAAFLAGSRAREVTAFLCMSDLIAVGALSAIAGAGYSVPDDYSVVGYDGIELTKYTTPSLTTVSQNVRDKGYEAVRLLCSMLEDGKREDGDASARPRTVVLPHTFIERGSVRKLL